MRASSNSIPRSACRRRRRYPTTDNESGLSDIALGWLIDKLKARNVRVLGVVADAPGPNPLGTRICPGGYPPFDALPQAPRLFPAFVGDHPSVAARLAGGPVVADPGLAPSPYI